MYKLNQNEFMEMTFFYLERKRNRFDQSGRRKTSKRYICLLKRSFKYSRNKRKQILFLLNRHNFDLMGIEVKIKIKRSALTIANLKL